MPKKEKTGVLFKNDKKTKDSHPLYKGQCLIGGTEYWIAAWVNESERGKYMSLKFEAKESQAPDHDDTEDVPF